VKVLVVGAGFAGVAAAFAARRAGAAVTLVHSGAGSSALYAGVVDGLLPDEQLPASLAELSVALGLRVAPGSVVATREGVVRLAGGSDAAVLDLAPLAGRRIAVVDVPRDDWDAPLLARAFAESAWARASGTRFELVPLELLEKSFQRRVSPYDFACSFERAERPAWLAETLKAAAGPDAWLFGPWLGVKRRLASELRASVGVPVGEVTSPPGGVAGARFEAARDALLGALEVEVVPSRATGVRQAAGGVALALSDGRELTGDALVLAAGGFVSGAVRLSGALSGAEPAGFGLELAGLPAVRTRGEPVGRVSSLFGVDLAAHCQQLLERVGLAFEAHGRILGAPRVFGAGDLLAPEPPSVGHALLSGLRAGLAAAAVGG
jgi:glycerol-3-phosphate dehydrogenase subunit B